MYKTTNFFKQTIIQLNLSKTNKTVVYKAFENLYLESVFFIIYNDDWTIQNNYFRNLEQQNCM